METVATWFSLLRQVWPYLGIPRSRQNFPCRDRESLRLKVSRSRHMLVCHNMSFYVVTRDKGVAIGFFLVSIEIGQGMCDAPNPGGPVDHRQPVENLCVSYHETHT